VADPAPASPKYSALTQAVCLDLPYILDSVWRRAEFNLNRVIKYEVEGSKSTGGRATLSWRRYSLVLPFWFFLVALIFVAYGPTFDAWCSVVGADGMRYSRATLGVLGMLAALIGWVRLIVYGEERCKKRFDKAPVLKEEGWRRFYVRAGVQTAILCIAASFGWFAAFLFGSRNGAICRIAPPVIPSNDPARWQFLLLLGAVVVALVLALRPMKAATRIYQQTALLLVMVLILWLVIVPPWASEANQSPYVHVYAAFACALAVIACCARPFGRWQFGTVSTTQRGQYRAALKTTELFPGSRKDPDVSKRRMIAALGTGIFYHLSEFMLLPAFFALLVPSRFLGWTVFGTCLVSAWLLMLGNYTARWRAMVSQVRRGFLLGTPLGISIGVIALALLRLFKVQYVTTILDAAPFGMVFVWIIMAYALLWWFEFSINGTVARELIAIVGGATDIENGYLQYLPDQVPPSQLTVQLSDRFIVPHGSGRFVALGYFYDKTSQKAEAAFQTFDLIELFERLTPDSLSDLWHDLRRRIELYFLAINAAVVLVLGAGAYYYGYGDRHNSVQAVVPAPWAPNTSIPADLTGLLARHDRVFIVAASGGGTRAALFTATALEGLENLGVAKDIVLLSGVSGGGVAEAYFYSHRDQLLSGAHRSDAWSDFKDHMTEPFIGDVLEGAGEWRLLSRQPLGQLLVESFARRLFTLRNGPAIVGQSNQLGLILNTSITAHPQEDSDLLREAFLPTDPLPTSCDARHIPYSPMSGGRLIFTNLADRQAFPPSGALPPTDQRLHLPDVRMPYVVVQDRNVPLSSAAALSANFPPVFTNARVDVASETDDRSCGYRAYYVTDGGATENLGLISALYALRASLEQMSPDQIPEIHIVSIEASATTYDYTPDRGFNASAGSSKERLTGGLTQELLDEVQSLASKGTKTMHAVQVHDLALPLAFRSRGAFGTHWMFPEKIVVENPQRAAPLAWFEHQLAEWFSKDPPTAAVDKQELIGLWTALHDRNRKFCAAPWKGEQRQIANWVCGNDSAGQKVLAEDLHIREWAKLVDAVSSK
jgi:Patatin-like phospholipase